MLMTRIYLAANSFIYLFFSALCLSDPAGTARFSGLSFLNGSGKAEYLTIYTGLEAGLGLYYFYATFFTSARRAALIFSAFLYGGIVLVRLPALILVPAVGMNTFALALLELLLATLAAICLLKKDVPSEV